MTIDGIRYDSKQLTCKFKTYSISSGATFPFFQYTGNCEDYITINSLRPMFLEPTTETEIFNIINSFGNSNAHGVHGLVANLAEVAVNLINVSLTDICNIVVSTGEQERVKVARICVIQLWTDFNLAPILQNHVEGKAQNTN